MPRLNSLIVAAFIALLLLSPGHLQAETIIVTTTADSGPGSLRDTLAAVPAGSTITFSPGLSGQVIHLTSYILVEKDVTIDATALPNGLTLSGGNATRLFMVGFDLTLRGLTLTGGDSDYGGAILNYESTLELTRCTLSGNTASGDGGAIYSLLGTVTLAQCTLAGNSAGNSGGAIHSDGGTLTLTQCTLSGNTAPAGGAILTHKGSGTTTLLLCTLAGNSATAYGGAIHNNSGLTTLTRCTISGNTSPAGGGVTSDGTPAAETVVHGSIVAGNTGGDVDLHGGSGFNSFTNKFYNLIGSGNATADFSQVGETINHTAATVKLGPLASNGGPTQTMALLPGSPAINRASVPEFETDQRGFPLVGFWYDMGGMPDIGAYEVQESSVTLVSSANPGLYGADITFTATVHSHDPEYATPTGTVVFKIDGVNQSPVALSASGTATLTTSTLGFGTHTVSAVYSGDARLLPDSYSNAFSQSIVPDVIVTNDNASGPGSLVQALINAGVHPGPDTITFDPVFFATAKTITPAAEILISSDVTVDATGLAAPPVISGGNTTRIFSVNAGAEVTLKGLTLTEGKASDFPGGGAISNRGMLMLTRCTLAENVTNSFGGSIYNFGTLALAQCTLSRNVADTGGAICSEGTLTLAQCTLSGNAAYSGGAISNRGSLTLDQCTLSGNLANYGGAISNSDTLTLTQCTLSGNLASDGGAIANDDTLTLNHCTVSGNGYPSSKGCGVHNTNRGTFTLNNSIVAGNSSTPGENFHIFNARHLIRIGVNIVQGVLTENPFGFGSDSGPPAINADPLLAPLGDYGGPTQTMPPLPGSPAIDQCLALNPALTTDQRGQPRPVGARADIGAVETGLIVVTTPVDELDLPGTPGTGVSLREAVRDIPAGGTIAFDPVIFTGATHKTITLTKGPLNPQRNCTLTGAGNPGGIAIRTQLTITYQPPPMSFFVTHGSMQFTVIVTNLSGGVTYQWHKNNTPTGIITDTLLIPDVQESDEGVYDVVIGAAEAPGVLTLADVSLAPFGGASRPAALFVDGTPMVITHQPRGGMLTLGGSITLVTDGVAPAPSITSQWMKNGKKIPGATKNTYTINNAQLSHAGAYTCVLKSSVGTLTSATAEIGVVDARPKTVDLLDGGSFSASVSAAGNGPLTFVWQKNGGPIGKSTKSFTIPVNVSDEGLYTCTVTGLAGTFTGGAPTQLNVSIYVPQLVTPLALPGAFIGENYFYQIPVQDYPGARATGFNVAGALPKGITYSKITGIISGRPTVTKTAGYPLTITASNAKGSSTPATATLTVNMVPPTAVGTFAGVIERSPLNDNLGGRFDLSTTGAGTFSGSITLGARKKLPFTNLLLHSAGEGDIILYGNIPGMTMADMTPLTAYVEIYVIEQLARLTLVHPNGTALVIPAWRNPWLVSKTPALNNPATAYATYYTLRLDPEVLGTSPRGYGYSSFTVSTAGALTLAGKLPDGSAITGGTFVGAHGEILLFNLLYANRGSHVGNFVISPAALVANNTAAGTTSWFKPAPLPGSKDTIYKEGFGPLTVTAAGSPYSAPAKGAIVPGFTAVVAPAANAQLAFTLGGLEAHGQEFTQPLRIANPNPAGLTNTATISAPVGSTKVSVFTASTGLFNGRFVVTPGVGPTVIGYVPPPDRPAPFFGQLVKIGATTQGYGYFLLPKIPVGTEKVTTSPKLSGRVVLGVP